MAIRPISNVSFQNNINFTAKKKSEQPNYYSNPMKKLAVPLAATVLSMMPMAASSRNMNIDIEDAAARVEMFSPIVPMQEDKVVATAKFDKGVLVQDEENPLGGYKSAVPVDIRLISNDGNDSNAEVLNFYFVEDTYHVRPVINGKRVEGLQDSGTCLNVDTLEIRNVEFNGKTTKEYYARGYGYDFVTQAKMTKPPYSPIAEYPNKERYGQQCVEITKEFYDWLKQVMGDEAVYINTQRKERTFDENLNDALSEESMMEFLKKKK